MKANNFIKTTIISLYLGLNLTSAMEHQSNHSINKQENLFRVNFSGKNLTNTDFRDEDLTGADFSRAIITGANFSNANLKGASFYKTTLSRANFTNANLECTCLKHHAT